MPSTRLKPAASAFFITFAGNCKKALAFYQTCFGGTLQLDIFEEALEGYAEMPVVSGSLVSDRIVIHGSDLVHSEGRTVGNYLSIFLPCKSKQDRQTLIEKLKGTKMDFAARQDDPRYADDQKLIEITDAFDVRWILGV